MSALYSKAELAEMGGVSVDAIRMRIRVNGIKVAAWRKVVVNHVGCRVALYPALPCLVKSQAQRMASKGWTSTKGMVSELSTDYETFMAFAEDVGLLKKEVKWGKGVRYYWRIPESMSEDGALRGAWVAWNDVRAAERRAAKREAERKAQQEPEPMDDEEDDGRDWLDDCDQWMRDLVMDERMKKLLVGQMVVVVPDKGPRFEAKLEFYNMAGFGVWLKNGKYRRYFARQAKVQALTKKEVEDEAEV